MSLNLHNQVGSAFEPFKEAHSHVAKVVFGGDAEGDFRQMIDVLPAAIYTTDCEGRITYFNRAAVEMSGRVPQLGTDEWCTTWKLERADGTSLPHGECPMAVALKEDRMVRGEEIVAVRPDGTRVWVMPYPTPVHDYDGLLIGGINMLVDISELRRGQEAQAHLAAIVASSDDAIIGKTLDGVITSWNRGAETIFGYSAAEAVGKHVSLIIPEERLGEEAEILTRLRQGDRIEHFETVRRAKDGRRLHISLSVSPIRDSSGRLIGAAKVARDITERKHTEELLREAQRMEGIGRLAGGMAHDFNNLLTAILGNATVAIEMLPPSHPTETFLRTVLRSSEKAADLIRKLLAYAGKAQCAPNLIDLSELVFKLRGPIQVSMPPTVQLQLELGSRLPPVRAEAVQLEDLVMDLVINAAEAIGQANRGIVRLSTSLLMVDGHSSSAESTEPNLRPGKYVVLGVQDNGIGMDDQVKAKIFEPFFTTKFLGRGLGLAAASGTVRSLGGAIKVASRPGEGSTFQVLLPACRNGSETA